jgi:hypothetical protein
MGVTIDKKGRERWKRRGREGVGPQDERKMKMKDLDLAFEHGVGFLAFDDGPSQQLGKINQQI